MRKSIHVSVCCMLLLTGLKAQEPTQLKEVTVRSGVSLVKREIDRISYNVQADPDHKVQSVLEMLAKVPLITVDGDNNIKLKGNGNFKVFINGKPSSLTARNPKEALKAMPTANIARIEVITTPPAKYDAEGLTGIINIVTIKQRQDGYSASIGSSYNRVVGLGQSMSLTAKKSKLGITASGYMYEDLKRTNTISTERYTTLSTLKQNGTNTYRSVFGSGTTELSYEADSLHLFTGSFSFYKSRDHSSSILSDEYENQLLNNSDTKDHTIDAAFNYEHGFKRDKRQLLSFAYQFHHSPEWVTNEIIYNKNSYLQQNNNLLNEHTMQGDYSLPIKQLLIETGIKTILRNGESVNNYRYKQNVYSVYQSYLITTHQLDVKAGIRFEYTHTFKNYLNWIPVISLQHNFNNNSLNLGFTRRIARPSIQQLNPFVDKSNPQFISEGNPDLHPVVQNSAELSFSSFTKLNYHLILSYQFANNNIEQITTVTDTLSLTSYQNIGNNRNLRLNAGFNYNLTSRLRMIFNTDAGMVWLKGSSGQLFLSNSGLTVNGFINLNYKISDTWKATSTVYATSSAITLQGETNAYAIHVTRLTKELFHKHGVISLSISNPYSKYRYIRTTTSSPDFHQYNSQQRYYRTFGISFNYSFGRLSAGIKKNKLDIKNDDVNIKTRKNS